MKTYALAGRIAGLALVMSAICAQSNAPAPSFEVASIRPADLPTPGAFRGGPPQQFRAGMQLDGSRLDWGLASLADMIQYAFRVKNYQVSGPDWMRSSRWNVLARLPEGASQDQAPEMMQALLADRFQLKIHREKREQPVYALEVAKGGAKLESISASPDSSSDDASQDPTTANTQAPGLFPGPFGGPFGRGPGGPPPDAPDGRGGRGPVMMTTTGANGATARISPGDNCALHLELSKLTMQDLADTLAPFLDKPVIDATELKGRYKATLDLPMEVMLTMMQNMMRANGLPGPGVGGFGRGPGDGGPDGRGGPGDGGPGGRGFQGCDPGAFFANGGADASNAPIFQAVQKLGLKLEARKAPFDFIVVDHLEKTPSEN
jgi:uncharacterized protein (TIGR03435 family)